LELLNRQASQLRSELASLQALLDDAQSRDEANQVQIQALGSKLNLALAQTAAEQKRRAELEAAERKRLEAEAVQLEKFRSDFFGRLREVLDNVDGVRIEGDRFVFSSEVLFRSGQAELSPSGRAEIAKVADILKSVSDRIPDSIDWIIRVDGHTDNVPLAGFARYANNWELSQARALSVVLYMNEVLGIPADRLAATGFGEYQPVNTADTPEARAQNRRIELKLTEK
ncbi:peptidoglycan -binding protein, partial [Brevirhabdus pacifica]